MNCSRAFLVHYLKDPAREKVRLRLGLAASGWQRQDSNLPHVGMSVTWGCSVVEDGESLVRVRCEGRFLH